MAETSDWSKKQIYQKFQLFVVLNVDFLLICLNPTSTLKKLFNVEVGLSYPERSSFYDN